MSIKNWRKCLIVLVTVTAAWATTPAQAMLMGGTFSNEGTITGDFLFDLSTSMMVAEPGPLVGWTIYEIVGINATVKVNGLELGWTFDDFNETTAGVDGTQILTFATDTLGRQVILSYIGGEVMPISGATFTNDLNYGLGLGFTPFICGDSITCVDTLTYAVVNPEPIIYR